MKKTLRLLVLALLPFSSLFSRASSPADPAQCPAADPNDDKPDDAALQACLDKGGTVNLQPGSPGYILVTGLRITKSGTVLHSRPPAGTPVGPALTRGWKALVLAAPNFRGTMLRAGGDVNNYTVSDIVFDGNLPLRTRASECSDGGGLGPNLSFEGSGFRVHGIVSMRALCGSAMIVLGRRFEIFGNEILDNGRSGDKAPGISAPWADGMTVLLCDNGAIYDNNFLDNTDIALVIGGGPNCNVQRNTIVQNAKHAFAGLNIGNFNNNGNHSGSVFARNKISARKDMLVWGLQLGSHPWSRGTQVRHAGTVAENTISGAMVNLAIDGVENGLVTNNRFSNPQGSYGYGVNGPGSGGGCRTAADYTAADFGAAQIQSGYIPRVYHDGLCPDVEDPGQVPQRAP